jgi:hypothetical protein
MSGKREFRRQSQPDKPEYPELEEFDRGRRRFFAQLGGALLGATALGTLLSACGDRAVGEDPEIDPPQGTAPVMDARVDTRPHVHVQELGGVAPPMEARVDRSRPDMPQTYAGVPRMMDAQLDVLAPDAGPPKSDH